MFVLVFLTQQMLSAWYETLKTKVPECENILKDSYEQLLKQWHKDYAKASESQGWSQLYPLAFNCQMGLFVEMMTALHPQIYHPLPPTI